MREKKDYLYNGSQERTLLLHSLVDMKYFLNIIQEEISLFGIIWVYSHCKQQYNLKTVNKKWSDMCGYENFFNPDKM